jgi:hypothetical protein
MKNEDECFDIENREESGGPMVQSPIEVHGLAMERIEKTAEYLRMAQ